MKRIYSIISIILGLCLLSASSVQAQTSNVLRIPDVTATLGKTSVMPVHLDNASEIVGVQFTIAVPTGMTLTTGEIALENRGEDHVANVRKVANNRYVCMVYSPTNKPLRGYTGKLLDINFTIADVFVDGSSYPLTLSDVVLGDATAHNVATSYGIGNLLIANGPDLIVKNVKATEKSLLPGGVANISWLVVNDSELPTTGGWREQVALVKDDGTRVAVGTVYNTTTIDGEGQMTRSASLKLPQAMGLEGEAKFQVKIIANADAGESTSAAANNTAVSDATVNVGKQLFVELPPVGIDENTTALVKCKLLRSGSWAAAETFTLLKSADDRVELPATVTIPKGQSASYFYIKMVDNEVLDDDSVVTISASGNGYEEVKTQQVIVDNEYPDLTITTPKYEIAEGETFQLLIEAARVSSKPVMLYLTCDRAEHFKYPAQVTLPAGAESVTVDVTAIEDNLPNVTLDAAFAVKASRYNSSECYIELLDNDLPEIALTLTPNTISEAAGSTAVMATLKRLTHNDNKVTVKLTDNSNGRLYYSTQSIVLEAGVSEAQFSIGVIDNELVDGEQEITVTAAIYISSCDCSASGTTAGVVAQTIKVLDDDGPALKITSTATSMLEGSENNVFTISRNVKSDTDVVVRINSDKDDILEYEHELTIPKGQSSVDFVVKVKNNEQQDDSHIATFNVEADGYAMGTCWILVTDQTLPDAVVSLFANKTEAEAEKTVLLRAVVKNVGNSTLRSTTPLVITFSGHKETVELKVGKAIAAGDSAIVEYNYGLPALIGNYTFEATINAAKKVPELIYTNNISEKVHITLLSPFNVTAQADKDIYCQGDSIFVSGTATGSAAENTQVEVYFINEESRQTVTATTDGNGDYTVGWKPLSKQSGHFIVGACYPGSKAMEEMDAFDVYGIRVKDHYKTHELKQTETKSGKIILYNPGNLVQTGLTVTPKLESSNCIFTYEVPNSIGAGEYAEIDYTIKGDSISVGRNWQKMPIEITTAEGSHLDYNIHYFVHPLKARLETSMSSINTTMTYGTPREYPLTIRNVGAGETGKITLALPDWIQTVTPSEMSSLAQGDSVIILLRLIPTESMKLNVRVSGHIGINCANGDGTSVSFGLTPVSEAKGKLIIDVVDEYSFFTNEAPHVSKAKVRIMNPSTNEVVAEGETDDNGKFATELPEGYYSIKVDADKHDSYANTVIVDPGVEKTEEVFLSYQAITYSWEVEETTIEDEYEYETIVKFEARVPKPVVIITLPDEQPEPYSIIPVILTNKGLINAVDVNLSLSVSNGYTLEFLNDPSLEVLTPQQSHVFYAKVVPEAEKKAAARVQRANSNSSRCFTIIARAKYKELCQKYTGEELAEAIKKWGKRGCISSVDNSTSGGNGGNTTSGGGSYGPGRPGYWNNNSYDDSFTIWDTDDPAKFCDKVLNDEEDGDDNNDEEGDEGEPEETDDCDEEPIFLFKIKDYNTGYNRKGVATDGLSKVKIVISSESKIPREECNVSYRWELSEDIGTLKEEDSWKKVVYTAPDNFPSDQGNTYSLSATLYYDTNKNEGEKIAYTIDIELVRPPVLFVHGLNSSGATWKKMIKFLTKEGLYNDFQLLAVDYESTHNETFATNVGKVDFYAKSLISLVNRKGYVSTKTDVVGHSMGGLLTKKCIQELGGNEFIRKAITLNTPHGGSQLGNFLNDPRVKFVRDVKDMLEMTLVFDPIMGMIPTYTSKTPHPISREFLNHIYKMFGPNSGDISNSAVSDLSVGGAAINSINNNSTSGVRCHAIVTTTENWAKTFLDNVFAAFEYPNDETFLNELFDGDESDLVVPLKSQKGGLESPYVSEFSAGWIVNSWDYFHMGTCEADDIMKEVRDLLKCDINDSRFSDGFNYTGEINFSMPTLNNVTTIYTESNSILPNHNDNITKVAPRRTDSTNENSLVLSYEFNEGDSVVSIRIGQIGNFSLVGFAGFYKNQILGYVNSNQGVLNLPEKINDDVIIMYEGKTSNGEWYSKSDTIRFNTIGSVGIDQIYFDLDTLYAFNDVYAKPQVYANWSDGSESEIDDVAFFLTSDTIAVIKDKNKLYGIKNGTTTLIAQYQEHECRVPVIIEMFDDNDIDDDEDSDDSPSICSTITLSFKQKSVMTRQAFRGTLTVNNGHETTAMKDVKMNLEVRDMDGHLTTSHEFQIDTESLKGFTGDLDFNSGWTLDGGSTGVATILFIPTKFAAPTEPKDYAFGGSFSYTDPYTGLTVTRELNPVTLTVNPSPNLEMTFFMQRDVFGDDPLTETVEPMVPSEFALIVNNKGYGDAENISLTMQQPGTIDNQKGIVIKHELISTQLNGGEKNLSPGGSMTSDFGTIPAHSQAYAQWWLQSSLLGHFIEYDVKATHLTSRNNPDLSLLDTVTIHELIHGFTVRKDSEKPLRGFLVNDIKDKEDLPDEIYFTDATQQGVYIAANANIVKQSDTEYVLSVNAGNEGWIYGSLADPTYGKQKLVKATRSDGTEVNVDNIWQTDRTLRDGKDPLYENRLHFVGNMPAEGETFYLTFEPKPDKVLEVESFVGVPASDVVVKDALKEVTVCFNKPIDAATFTTEDLTLNCQGKALDVSQIQITQVSDTKYKLGISALSAFNGLYVLTVQTAGIIDNEGFAGEAGKTASWVQYVGGKVNLMIKVAPDNAGMVTPAAGLYDYEEKLTLTATANEGYEFLYWSSSDEVIATMPTHEYLMEGDAVITATFAPKNYNVEIVCDVNEGVVTGAGTGVYPYGNVLSLTADPLNGYIFDGWYIADSKVAESSTYVHTVDSAVQIEARFTQVIYDLTLRLENGWNWISAYFADEELMTSWKFLAPIKSGIERVVGMEKEIVNDPEYGLTGNLFTLSPTEGYKVKTNRLMLNTWTGVKANTNSTQIALKKGWNWIGYPVAIDMEVNEAFANAEPDNEDYIVGQDGFAQYTGGEWIGTLETLETGKGYMYYSKSNKEFTYNTAIYAKAPSVYRSSVVEETPWSANKYKYPNIMCMIAELFIDDTVVDMENCIVGAFCGDECRGVGSYVNGEVMISIYGEKNEDITFKVMDNDTERTFDVLESVPFTETLLGTVKQPYPLHISDGTGVLNVQGNWRVQVENGNLYLSLNNKMFDHVALTDVYGNTILTIENVASGEPINVSTFIDGVYIVSVEQDGIMYYKKIMIVGKQ